MDFLSEHDRKLSDFDMNDDGLLGSDMFASSMEDPGEEDSFMKLPTLLESNPSDWFNTIFDVHGLVYNDKNLGEAASQPCIKSEHSYSSNNLSPSSPLTIKEENTSPCPSPNSSLELTQKTQKTQLIQAAATASQPKHIKYETLDSDPFLMAMTSPASSTTFTHQTKIILTTSPSAVQGGSRQQTVFPTTVHFKAEPMDMDTYETLAEQTVNVVDTMVLPPTPPSSNGSDSDGSQSPPRSAPNSPQRQSPVRVYQYHHIQQAASPQSTSCAAQTYSQSIYLGPMSQSGVLILTEEEKRTLISEGYPVPAKLPLTKQEEKNLKKVRRKIKNKISAQESRRKKKEYVEALEKRMEAYNQENMDLRKKVESLESNNRSLLGQLQKLQALVSKVPQTATTASSSHPGTVLMVLMLCFAVFLGGSGLGPTSLNMGYLGVSQAPLALQSVPASLLHHHHHHHSQPDKATPLDSSPTDYSTPNLKSRVLLALSREDMEDHCQEDVPLLPWESDHSSFLDTEWAFESAANACHWQDPPLDVENGDDDDGFPAFTVTEDKQQTLAEDRQQTLAVVSVAPSPETNATGGSEDSPVMMHPDIAVEPSLGSLADVTADLETA